MIFLIVLVWAVVGVVFFRRAMAEGRQYNQPWYTPGTKALLVLWLCCTAGVVLASGA